MRSGGMDETPWYDHVVMPALLRHARTAYGAAMRRALAAHGHDDVPANGLYVIGGLALNGDGVPLGQLIRELRLSKQSAGMLVDTLVERGYLTRETDPGDRRRTIITLTVRGREAARIQAAARGEIDAELLAGIGADSVAQARRALGMLCDIGRRRSEAAG